MPEDAIPPAPDEADPAIPPAPDEEPAHGDALQEGLSGAAEEAWGKVKGILSIPGGEGFKDVAAEYRAFDDARKQGKGVVDSAKAASEVTRQKHDAISQLEDRVKEFSTNPAHATGKAIVDLIPLALGFGLKGGAAGAAESEAGEAATGVKGAVGNPSDRLVLSPEEAQAQAQMQKIATKRASEHGMQHAAGMRPPGSKVPAAATATDTTEYPGPRSAEVQEFYDKLFKR